MGVPHEDGLSGVRAAKDELLRIAREHDARVARNAPKRALIALGAGLVVGGLFFGPARTGAKIARMVVLGRLATKLAPLGIALISRMTAPTPSHNGRAPVVVRPRGTPRAPAEATR